MTTTPPSDTEKLAALYRSKLHGLRDQYDARHTVALGVLSRAQLVLQKGIADCGLRCDVTARLKNFDSFRLKFRSKFLRYLEQYRQTDTPDWWRARIIALVNDPFSEITDLVGVRCVGLFSTELYRFEGNVPSVQAASQAKQPRQQNDLFRLQELIMNRFDDSKKLGSRPAPRADEKLSPNSGYRSVHYDLCLKHDCVVPSLEQSFLGFPFELQLRTYSQHMVDDVSHFLSYKSDDVFFPSSHFNERTAALQNKLESIQDEIDSLFEESRRVYQALLTELRRGQAKTLMPMRVTPDTLRLYALYEFVFLKCELPGVPDREEDAKFSELWLRELSDGLNLYGLSTIQQVQEKTRDGMEFVDEYARASVSRKSIFKPGDLTDLLSKCLLFSVDELSITYPVLSETRDRIAAFKSARQQMPTN